MPNDDQQLYLRCLVAAHDLETYGIYYEQCEGRAFAKARTKATKLFFGFFDRLPSSFIEKFECSWNKLMKKDPDLKDTIAGIRAWETNEEVGYIDHLDFWGLFVRQDIRFFFTVLRWELLEVVEIGFISERLPDQDRLNENWIKWRGHLPRFGSVEDPEDVMAAAGKSKTIVVVGDIRRSQDLMTYGESAEDYSDQMFEFLSTIRILLNENGAIFDKFTGDGFIAYFNEEVCKHCQRGRNTAFGSFVRESKTFCHSHFEKWIKKIRKIPGEAIGLAVGADIGRVAFTSQENHFITVGESIVWATRMAAAASADEVLVNNLLYQELRETPDLSFEAKRHQTKSGESFQAWAMTSGNPPSAANPAETASDNSS